MTECRRLRFVKCRVRSCLLDRRQFLAACQRDRMLRLAMMPSQTSRHLSLPHLRVQTLVIVASSVVVRINLSQSRESPNRVFLTIVRLLQTPAPVLFVTWRRTLETITHSLFLTSITTRRTLRMSRHQPIRRSSLHRVLTKHLHHNTRLRS